MKKSIVLMIWFVALAALTACGTAVSAATPAAITDTFFSAQALLDVNGNGQIDEEDTPIAGATFIVALPSGAEFGAQTDESGKAFVTIPASVEYPVTARMEAPKDSALNIIEPSTITLKEPKGETIQFLFGKQ
ncbi:MAG: hypothetical protein ACOYYI_06405 [Chloroflexota bacterium]